MVWKLRMYAVVRSSHLLIEFGELGTDRELQRRVPMNKKGDKDKVSYHDSALQLLSWICESEVTHFHDLFRVVIKDILISNYNSKPKENKSPSLDSKKTCISWSPKGCKDLGVRATA